MGCLRLLQAIGANPNPNSNSNSSLNPNRDLNLTQTLALTLALTLTLQAIGAHEAGQKEATMAEEVLSQPWRKAHAKEATGLRGAPLGPPCHEGAGRGHNQPRPHAAASVP